MTAMRSAMRVFRTLASAVAPRWYNKKVCSFTGVWDEYFDSAEPAMDTQWDEVIWPMINDFDFETVLELAPGVGRNTEKLVKIAKTIHAVDVNEGALKRLRERFENYTGDCNVHFHKNNGRDLSMIEDNSITTIYSWDSAVHFERGVMRDYIGEFSRILRPGGTGFVHHSDMGESAKSDFTQNPAWRTNMSRALFEQYCKKYGLEIIDQAQLPWGEVTDCLSVFRKPSRP